MGLQEKRFLGERIGGPSVGRAKLDRQIEVIELGRMRQRPVLAK